MLTFSIQKPTHRRALAVAGVAASLLAGAVLFLLNPLQQLGWLRCPVNLATGLYCPGCGSLRATHALLHGDLLAALDLNALAVIAIPLLLLIGAYGLVNAFRGERFILRVSPGIAWTVFGVIMLFTLLRNLPLDVLFWLRP